MATLVSLRIPHYDFRHLDRRLAIESARGIVADAQEQFFAWAKDQDPNFNADLDIGAEWKGSVLPYLEIRSTNLITALGDAKKRPAVIAEVGDLPTVRFQRGELKPLR